MPTSARDFISDKIANIVQNISFRINFVWGDVGIAPYGLSRCKHLDKLKFEGGLTYGEIGKDLIGRF